MKMYDQIYSYINANLTVQHVIQVRNGLMINVNVSVKCIIPAEKIIVRSLAYVFLSIVSI